MKLSQIKGERTIDVIADCIDPIVNIANDTRCSKLLKREKLPEGETPEHFVLERIRANLPDLLRYHKADIIAIFSAIEGVSKEEYTADLDVAKLLANCMELMSDEVLVSLFTSAQTKTDAHSSGSASVNTEDRKAH